MNIQNSARNKRKSKQKGLRKMNKCRNFLNDESSCVLSHEDEKQENIKISQMIKESAANESVFCQNQRVSSDNQLLLSQAFPGM